MSPRPDFRVLLCTLATCAAVSCPSSAQVVPLGHYGFWNAFAAKANDGHYVCGVSSGWTGGRDFLIKWFAGMRFLSVQIFRRGWHIPAGLKVDVIVQFDNAEPWSAKAEPLANGGGLEFTVLSNQADTFVNEVRLAAHMTVTFPDGSEPPWVGSMAGSNLAMQAMLRCMGVILDGTESSQTQPYATPPATQPFGSAPSAAQPPTGSLPSAGSQPAAPQPTKSQSPSPLFF